MNLNLLEKSIITTITYYDVLDYPLTGFEVFKYLINPLHIVELLGVVSDTEIEPIGKIELIDVLEVLKNRNLSFYIEEKNGFYFLKGNGEIIKIRIERQKISDEMWKKTKKIVKWLQFIPYIKMVAVSGSLAMYNAKKESDIDLLIVAKNKRIWTARFMATLFFQIIGERRYGKKTAGRFCLNHYIADESLKINFPSLYNAQTYAHLVPILEGEKGIYNKFQQENNWMNNYLAFYDFQKLKNQQSIKINSLLRFIARVNEIILNTFIGNILEKILRFFQKRHIKKHSSQNQGEGRIVVNDNQLEFHPDSPEAGIIDKYNQKMLELGFEIIEKNSGLNKN
ncbi:nucleotidyltransferase domain-containing protein [Patescibacteria group bacterium]|nr:nucleotidyltransferase domain-containing protein [Patescibacteria group bacterium]MBU4458572.1 nucleotidyltransferase domain-containing protein [Patescibacteria group bacterium]MCG2696100.1 nucleotidyltransferase domain-containing protein [Candidatus Portnoybacteria bacterium]